MAQPYTLTTLIKIRKCCFLQHTCNKTSKFYNNSTAPSTIAYHCPVALQFIDEVERVLKKLPCELADLGRAATGRAECSQYAQLKAAAAVSSTGGAARICEELILSSA
jgi:hypothetical protein